MSETEKLRTLLDSLLIDYITRDDVAELRNGTVASVPCTIIATAEPQVFIYEYADGLHIEGFGYAEVWGYSAGYVANMLDDKFRKEMIGGGGCE